MKAGNLPFPDLQGITVGKFRKETDYQSRSLSCLSVNDVVNLSLKRVI